MTYLGFIDRNGGNIKVDGRVCRMMKHRGLEEDMALLAKVKRGTGYKTRRRVGGQRACLKIPRFSAIYLLFL